MTRKKKIMKPQDSFKSVLAALNPEQKQAVTTIEGPTMVIAGPGTGKTHVLAARVAYILDTQEVSPSNILALTFTDAAAKNMRERIVSMIGTAGYRVAIATFHSFCGEVLATHPEFFDLARESQPLTDLERHSIFEEVLLGTQLEALKPLNRPLYYLKEVQSRISDLKRENVSPDKFEFILSAEAQQLEQDLTELTKSEKKKREKNLLKQKELLTLYVKYQALLRERNRYDFDDMITMVVEAFQKHDELLAEYQEQLHYILVDEYQDTNSSQNAIVDLLASWWGADANVFVVGDPHQSIFRFQGASVENMLGFLERYPDAAVITLKTGYRCPQSIYDAAHTSISQNSSTLVSEKSLQPQQERVLQDALTTRLLSPASKKDTNSKITVLQAPTRLLENHSIVTNVSQLLEKGVQPQEIAILYKNHADASELSELFLELGIPFETDYSGNVYDDEYVRQLIAVLRVIQSLTSQEDSSAFFDVLLLDWLKLPRLAVLQVARIASKQRTAFVEVLEHDVDKLASKYSIDTEGFTALKAFKQKIEDLRAQAANKQFHAWFEVVISDEGLGLFNWLVKNAPQKSHIFALNSLFSEIKKWVQVDAQFSLNDFISAVDTCIENGIVLKTQTLRARKNVVTFSTVHKAKGQEWKYVFIHSLRDKKWGNTTSRTLLPLPGSILSHVDVTDLEQDEDDRRLFYVALTRARRQTYLSFAATESEGKSVRTYIQSLFLSEIMLFVEQTSDEDVEKRAQQIEKAITTEPKEKKTSVTQSEKDFYSALISDFTLSVTSLNAYLKEPKEFLYNSLLKIPRAKEPFMSFGTAIHNTLEDMYAHLDAQQPQLPPLEKVHAIFIKYLQKEQLAANVYRLWEKKGHEALTAYYHHVQGQVVKPLFTERFFGGMFGRTVLHDGAFEIPLSGRLDRIDLIDPVAKTVRLVDYKTGKPRSSNAIVASTQTSQSLLSDREKQLPEAIRGPYKRQLIFYVLLAQLDASFPYTVSHAVFEFVEPTPSGSLVSRSFTITQEEVALLKELIIEVMREIRSLSFLELLEE